MARIEGFECWREDRGEGKEGLNIKGGTEIGNPILIRGGNAHKTYLEMVGRLAHEFTSIHNDLIVTFK